MQKLLSMFTRQNHFIWRIFLCVLSFSCFQSCRAQPAIVVPGKDTRIEYMGRVGSVDSVTKVIYWQGTSVQLNFTGSEVKAWLKDQRGQNYYYVIVDGVVTQKIRIDTIKQCFTLASNLPKGRHSVQLYRLTEGRVGKTWFYGFELSAGSTVLPPGHRDHRIEFYGNSITAGFGLDSEHKDDGDPRYSNNFCTYAGITARHYNATYCNISKSGIGLMLSWFSIIMPEMYDRLDPEDSAAKWDFSLYRPDLVVISLGQNDSWLLEKPEHAQFKARFGTKKPDEAFIVKAYQDFVRTIRGRYPQASIICILGCMDAVKEGSPWPGYVEKAVSGLHDPKVFSHFFKFNNSKLHPKKADNEAMALSLEQFIDGHIKW